jgi:hypothetical protein
MIAVPIGLDPLVTPGEQPPKEPCVGDDDAWR